MTTLTPQNHHTRLSGVWFVPRQFLGLRSGAAARTTWGLLVQTLNVDRCYLQAVLVTVNSKTGSTDGSKGGPPRDTAVGSVRESVDSSAGVSGTGTGSTVDSGADSGSLLLRPSLPSKLMFSSLHVLLSTGFPAHKRRKNRECCCG